MAAFTCIGANFNPPECQNSKLAFDLSFVIMETTNGDGVIISKSYFGLGQRAYCPWPSARNTGEGPRSC